MRAQRFETQEQASLEVYGKSLNLTVDLKNISQTGACLEYPSEEMALDRGDLIRLTVFLKSVNKKHNISAEVIWKIGNRTGVAFIAPEQVIEKLTSKYR